jgi:uncharacterized protein (DUF302 family)
MKISTRLLTLLTAGLLALPAVAQQPAQPDPETMKRIMEQQAEITKAMFEPRLSKFDFDETVSALTKSAQREGWTVKTSVDMGGREGTQQGSTKVHMFFMCPPAHLLKIEKNDKLKTVASIMPCRYTVFLAPDGKVYIASINNAKMSEIIGGEVGQLIADAGKYEAKLLAGIVQ